jgi:hypothetical protein
LAVAEEIQHRQQEVKEHHLLVLVQPLLVVDTVTAAVVQLVVLADQAAVAAVTVVATAQAGQELQVKEILEVLQILILQELHLAEAQAAVLVQLVVQLQTLLLAELVVLE